MSHNSRLPRIRGDRGDHGTEFGRAAGFGLACRGYAADDR